MTPLRVIAHIVVAIAAEDWEKTISGSRHPTSETKKNVAHNDADKHNGSVHHSVFSRRYAKSEMIGLFSLLLRVLGWLFVIPAGFYSICALGSLVSEGNPTLALQFVLIVAVLGGIAAALFAAAKGVLRIPVLRAEAERRSQQEQAERERQRQQEIAAINAHKNQQQQYHSSLIAFCTQSFSLFESMPIHLMDSEELLDQAEKDFEEGAFAPFWDSVERAAMKLGQFDNGVRTITTNAKTHTDVTKRYEGTAPPFPIILDSVTGMAAANTTTNRMKAVVRTAQRNFQFATIFEQRKTNQLLVAGFTNLAQALDGMASRIESSIGDLSSQISEMSSSLDDSLQNLGSNLTNTLTNLHESSMESAEKLASQLDGLHATVQRDATDRAERHKRALNMLDNIQRRRKPLPHKVGDGAF